MAVSLYCGTATAVVMAVVCRYLGSEHQSYDTVSYIEACLNMYLTTNDRPPDLFCRQTTANMAYVDDEDEGDDLPVALWKQRRGRSSQNQ